MQTAEIVLAIGVFAAIAFAAAFAGIRRRLRVPAAPQDVVRERDDAKYAGAAVPDLNQLLCHTRGGICHSPPSTCTASDGYSKSPGSTSSRFRARR